jgi:hypothetical protein
MEGDVLMKHLILILFLCVTSLAQANDIISFDTWGNFKTFMAGFSDIASKQPWKRFQTPIVNGAQSIIGSIDGIYYSYSFADSNDLQDFNTNFRQFCNGLPPKTDSEGRFMFVEEAFNSDFRGQWTSSADYINVATPSLSVRNQGQWAIWDTSTTDNVVYPASASLATGEIDPSCYSIYHSNGMNHYVHPDQCQIPDGWVRKRLRFLFRDTINLKQGLIKFSNAQHGNIFVDSYIVQRNLYFNHTQPASDTNLPYSIIVSYVSKINLEGTDYEDFTEVKASADLPFYMDGVGPVLELWVEITYNPSVFETVPCTGSARAWIYRATTYGH